jgi:hypothetical protein
LLLLLLTRLLGRLLLHNVLLILVGHLLLHVLRLL